MKSRSSLAFRVLGTHVDASPSSPRTKLCTQCLAASSLHLSSDSTRRPYIHPKRSHHQSSPPRPSKLNPPQNSQKHSTTKRFAHHNANSSDHPHRGPMAEYGKRVESGLLRNDEHQRGIVQELQDLHDRLITYTAPAVIRPQHSTHLKSTYTRSLLASLANLFLYFSSSSSPSNFVSSSSPRSSSHRRAVRPKSALRIPASLPKGLYMYGDVGSGKTMLMDMFYDTLPQLVETGAEKSTTVLKKWRIHFHSFMQDVHKRLHAVKMARGGIGGGGYADGGGGGDDGVVDDFDAVATVAADMAEQASVLCFDEFQCTDVADAMILRRLLEALMSHGVVLVTTSNRPPDDLYKNGIQRQSFLPCINLLKSRLRVINLDSTIDYRKMPRPSSGVYHHPLDTSAVSHAQKWFRFLGDPDHDPPHPATHEVWGREVRVPCASGRCAMFTFDELIGRATGAADYLELMRQYEAFVVTDVPGMSFRERDLARRFITFIDAVYESHAKLVLTTAVPIYALFTSKQELATAIHEAQHSSDAGSVEGDIDSSKSNNNINSPMENNNNNNSTTTIYDPHPHNPLHHHPDDTHLDDVARQMMDDLGLSMAVMKGSSLFSGDEERFAFARALSRLSEMGGQEWVERGLGLEHRGGEMERKGWMKVRGRWREDSL